MKMREDDYQKLLADVRRTVEGVGPHRVRTAFAANAIRTVWDVYHRVAFDRTNDDGHPAFKSGGTPRYVEHDPKATDLYSYLNDSHIQTAMLRAFRDMGIGS